MPDVSNFPENAAFFFNFNLFGVDIDSMCFTGKNLDSPDFSAEAVETKLAARPQDILAFFSRVPKLSVFIVCGTEKLAVADIDIAGCFNLGDDLHDICAKFQGASKFR